MAPFPFLQLCLDAFEGLRRDDGLMGVLLQGEYFAPPLGSCSV